MLGAFSIVGKRVGLSAPQPSQEIAVASLGFHPAKSV